MFKFIDGMRYKYSRWGRADIEDLNSNLRQFKQLLHRCYEVDYERGSCYRVKHFKKLPSCNEENIRLLENIEDNIFECLFKIGNRGLKSLAFYEYCCNEGEALCLFCDKAQEDIGSYTRLPEIYPLYRFNKRRRFDELKDVSFCIQSEVLRYPIEVAIGVAYHRCSTTAHYSAYGINFSNSCCLDKNYAKSVSFIYDRCRIIANYNRYFAEILYSIVLSFLHICSFKSRYSDRHYFNFFNSYSFDYRDSAFFYDFTLAPLLYTFLSVNTDFDHIDFGKNYRYFRKAAEYCMDEYIEEARKSYYDLVGSGISPLFKFEDSYELLKECFDEIKINNYSKCKNDYTIDTHIYMYELLQDLESFFIENPPEFLQDNKYTCEV